MAGEESNGAPPEGMIRPNLGAYSQPDRAPDGPGAGGNSIQPDLTTTGGRITENEARVSRNESRSVRRDAGEEGVEADEELLELEETWGGGGGQRAEPRTQPPAPVTEILGPASAAEAAALASLEAAPFNAFMLAMKQEGDLKEKALEYLQNIASGKKKSDKHSGLLKEGPELPPDQRGRRSRIDRRLITLLKLGFHLPLTLCTNEALEIVRAAPARLQCKTQSDIDGNKVIVVDPTAGWREELSLTPEEWRDAWTNLLQILPEVVPPEAVARFQKHHTYLVQQHSFHTLFPAILRFDIGIRHDYFWGAECTPFHPGDNEYVADLMKICSTISMERSNGNQNQDAGSGGGGGGVRYHPYQQNQHNQGDRGGGNGFQNRRGGRGGHGGGYGGGGGGGGYGGGGFQNNGQRPFGAGRGQAAGGSLCLICAQTGHRADACTRTRLPNGNAVFATFANNQLCAVASGNALCMSWNATGRAPCTNFRCPGANGGHTCSFCGTAGHHADVFEEELRRWGLWEEFGYLPTRLRGGFPIGNMEPLTRTFTPENHKGGKENMDFIEEYVAEQVALGHMTGPYSRERVEGILGTPFRSSPLSVVEKAGSVGKWRLIQNCSFPDEFGVSVNDMIDSDDFPTKWGTAAEVAEITRAKISAEAHARVARDQRGALWGEQKLMVTLQVATAPPGAQMATLDIDSAFRRIPIWPPHKAYLVVQAKPERFMINHVCCFGIGSGPGLQGGVMDPFVALLDVRLWGPNKKWVDDLNNMRFPIAAGPNPGEWVYGHSVEDIFELAGRLGVPLHQEKWTRHAYTGVYAGFVWDLPNKTVAIAESKRDKYVRRLDEALAEAREGAGRVNLKTMQKLNGTLSHCTFVYTSGRSFLAGLSSFIASFNNEHAGRYPPKSVISDLKWWRAILAKPSIKRPLVPRGEIRDLDMWVDASSNWGIGIVIGKEWDAWRWAVPYREWHAQGRDIGWAEMVAIELLMRRLEELGWENADFRIRSDNDGVIKAFRKGRSRNWQVNLSIRRTEHLCIAHNLFAHPEYVNTKVNRADPVSRGTPGSSLKRFRCGFEMPKELAPYLSHV
ncbi:hypothetical protein TRAPUB_4263 [Trametes pubescens]|uniref:Uncharacterized protein n=1 Tax=Trametes pubescens TaxID=154538 RepID=A0A1M2VB93_TRAPU|nr:hypothetical protein TRAPUB_4263 [Trametes pubescens]